MEYTTLTGTGMTVSRLCLGCMSFGSTDHYDWVLEGDDALAVIERAIDLGINFFDTANIYSRGESERLLGEALEGRREEMVVATKVYNQMDDDPNTGGLSRKTIEQELAASLDRLGMDSIDLYQIHRWDDETPIEVTMRALDDAVRRGQVRSLGASSMWAHQFAEALYTSDRLGLDRFVTMQDQYNLAYREEEREMLPLCAKEGIGVLPWSPLAKGYLTRPHEDIAATTRGETDPYIRSNPYRSEGGRAVNERVQQVADDHGVTMAQVALAWLLHKDVVDAPIVGVSSVEHLEAAVEALEVDLSSSDVEYLEEPYEPVRVVGHV